jgi:hypothetical protein
LGNYFDIKYSHRWEHTMATFSKFSNSFLSSIQSVCLRILALVASMFLSPMPGSVRRYDRPGAQEPT